MPFKSKSQQRYMFSAEAKGDLPKGTAKRWAHHTKDIKSLPEHVKHATFEDKLANILFEKVSGAPLPPPPRPMAPMVDTASLGRNIRSGQGALDSTSRAVGKPIYNLAVATVGKNLPAQVTSAAGQQELGRKFVTTPQYKQLPPQQRATVDSMNTNLSYGRGQLSRIPKAPIAVSPWSSDTSRFGMAKNLISSKDSLAGPVNRGLSIIGKSNPSLYSSYRDSTISRGGTPWSKSDSLMNVR